MPIHCNFVEDFFQYSVNFKKGFIKSETVADDSHYKFAGHLISDFTVQTNFGNLHVNEKLAFIIKQFTPRTVQPSTLFSKHT